MAGHPPIPYPRRQASRSCLRQLAANNFAFTDAPFLPYACPRTGEFMGGAERPDSPVWTRLIRQSWGFIRAYRGGLSRSTLTASLGVIEQDGVPGIFPEAGSWADLLRPARPGLAFLSLHSRAPVIPVCITGSDALLAKPRGKVGVQLRPPIPPPLTRASGRAERQALDAFSETVVAAVATGLPDAQRGRYADDPVARAAAEAVSAFPFHAPEMRGM